MSDQQPGRSAEEQQRPSTLAGLRRLPALSAHVDDGLAHLDARITDEAAGVEGRLRLSLAADVARLEDLIRATNERIDAYMGALARVTTLAQELDVRLQELADLREQPRAAERAEGRRLAALEAAVARLVAD
jgi:hypothetical protein